MADNSTVAEESLSKPSSLVKGQSGSSGTGSMSSTASSKTHSLKHGLNMSHTGSGIKGVAAASVCTAACTSEMNKHHHHHHHHHHHNHGHNHNNPHVIHRTTSESLRLGSDIASSLISGHSSSSASTNCNSSASNTGGGGHTNAQVTNQRKPKTSSFQITSVTVGNKLSADNGEDSADDLDESHTDDNSRITDIENETPSVSEDTFSKEDVFFSSNALGAAPVIPTSSQYGLVIVDPDLGGVGTGGQTLSNVHVSVTDAGINIVGPAGTKLCDADQKDLQHRNERFKVVKIESTEPFKRGRWMCMDYLDHTTLQQSQPNSESPSGGQSLAGSSGNPMTNDSGVNVTENHVDATEDPPDINLHGHMQGVSPGQTLQNPISGASADPVRQSQTQPNVTASGGENVSNSIHAQTLTHVPNAPQVSMSHQSIPQSLPHVSVQQTSTTQQPHSQTSINFAPVSNSSLQGQSQPAQFYANNQQQQQPQNVTISHAHGATLPTNITMQNGIPTSLATVTEQPTPQEISQPIQPVQPVQSAQQIQQNALPSTSIPSSEGLQEHGNIPVSTSLPQQQQQQQQQPASIAGTVLEQKPQSASQTQVSGETYVPHSVSQSYAAPPTSTSSISNVAGAASIGQEINTDISIAGMSQTPQSSGVISPAGAGTPASSTVPSIDSSIQSGIVASATSIISEGAPTSSVSSISDPSSLITTPQPQPQVPITASLQSQQSIIASEESQSAAGETDTERISSLAFALTSQKHSSSICTPINIINAPETFKDQPVVGPHFYRSHNLVNIKKSNNFLSVENPNQSLKLGQKLTLNIKQNIANETANIIGQQSNVIYGIPIPKPKNSPLEFGISRSASPTSGGREISPFFCDSLSTSPNSAILASSYEPPSSFIHPSLKEIGKTLSTPLLIKSTIAENQNNKYDFYVNQTQQQFSKVGICNRLPDNNNNNSASGTSAVAIDNKIEQAMDLVKSHLMIAVREEVEVLKEKIAELMDRINQLELENTILKANVSQETLTQLSATIQTAATTNSATAPPTVQKPPQNTNTSNGPVS